jgi:hypothetical protein
MNTFIKNKVLGIATKNPGKFNTFCELLDGLNLEIIFLNDLETVIENDTVKENAILKAVSASNQVDIPVLSTDESMHLTFLEEEKQPNEKIKRIVNVDPTDEEMLKYYLDILNKQENKIGTGIIETYSVIAYKGLVCDILYEKDSCFFKYPGSTIRISGRPLASLDYYPKYNKYYTELSNEEKDIIYGCSKKIISDFVAQTLNEKMNITACRLLTCAEMFPLQ